MDLPFCEATVDSVIYRGYAVWTAVDRPEYLRSRPSPVHWTSHPHGGNDRGDLWRADVLLPRPRVVVTSGQEPMCGIRTEYSVRANTPPPNQFRLGLRSILHILRKSPWHAAGSRSPDCLALATMGRLGRGCESWPRHFDRGNLNLGTPIAMSTFSNLDGDHPPPGWHQHCALGLSGGRQSATRFSDEVQRRGYPQGRRIAIGRPGGGTSRRAAE